MENSIGSFVCEILTDKQKYTALYNELLATPLEASRRPLRCGLGEVDNLVIVILKRKIFYKNVRGGDAFFSSSDFSWEVGGTLPQNSYKPSHDL